MLLEAGQDGQALRVVFAEGGGWVEGVGAEAGHELREVQAHAPAVVQVPAEEPAQGRVRGWHEEGVDKLAMQLTKGTSDMLV